MLKLTLLYLIFIVFYLNYIWCDCHQSYVTICDSVSDLKPLRERKTVFPNEVLIESKNGTPNETLTFDFAVSNLLSLTVIGALKHIEVRCCSSYAFKLLNLYKNDLQTLSRDSFPPKSKFLVKLSLTQNNISSIEPLTFQNLQPKIIDLSENQIERIVSETFTCEKCEDQIQLLILKQNRLIYLEIDSLPRSLRILNLDDNYLSSLETELFNGLPNLEYISASRNKFSILPNMLQLQKILVVDFSHNQISRINRKFCGNAKNVQLINLGYNEIAKIKEDIFDDFHQLRNLDLGYNKLSELPFIKPLLQKGNIGISLVFNNLENGDPFETGLSDNTTCDSSKLILFGNPWDCLVFDSLQEFLQTKHIKQHYCDSEYFKDSRIPFCFDNSFDNGRIYELDISEQEKIRREAHENYFKSIQDLLHLVKCSLNFDNDTDYGLGRLDLYSKFEYN